jgi:hypothetical protein
VIFVSLLIVRRLVFDDGLIQHRGFCDQAPEHRDVSGSVACSTTTIAMPPDRTTTSTNPMVPR